MRKTIIALIVTIAPLAHGQTTVSTPRTAELPSMGSCATNNNPRLTVYAQCNRDDDHNAGIDPCRVSNNPRLPLELWAQQVQRERRYAHVSDRSNVR